MATTFNDGPGEPDINVLLDEVMDDNIRKGIAEGRLRFALDWQMFQDLVNSESCIRPRIVIEPATANSPQSEYATYTGPR